jgi:hypothetical protein
MHTKLIHQVNLVVSEVNQMLVSYLRCSFYQNKQKRTLKQLFLGHHRYTPVLSVSFSIRVDHGTESAERVPGGSDLCDFIISE